MELSQMIKQAVDAQFDDFKKDLEFLTNIDSPTGHIENSRKIAKWLQERVAELGGTTEVRDNGRGAHVFARFNGNGTKKILLVVHTDTVLDTDGGKWKFTIDQNNIARGPGAGDCKASAVQMLHLVKAMQTCKVAPYKELTIFFDAEEEGGSADEKKFAKELANAADYAIICDTGRPNWGVCTKRKGKSSHTITVSGGKDGHAGNAPHAAANAVAEAANLVSKIYALAPIKEDPSSFDKDKLAAKGETDHGQFIPENYINIASISTPNTKMNVIPGEAVVKIETRCYEMAELEHLHKAVLDICSKPSIPGIQVTVEGGIQTAPMQKTPEAGKLFELYKNIVKREYNADVVEWVAGGLTIGNTTSEVVPTIDALGVDVDPLCEHTKAEYVDLNTFKTRTVALVHLIKELN